MSYSKPVRSDLPWDKIGEARVLTREAEQETQQGEEARTPTPVPVDAQEMRKLEQAFTQTDLDKEVQGDAAVEAEVPSQSSDDQASKKDAPEKPQMDTDDGPKPASIHNVESIKALWKKVGKPKCTIVLTTGAVCDGFHAEVFHDEAKALHAHEKREALEMLQKTAPELLKANRSKPKPAEEDVEARKQATRQARKDRKKEKISALREKVEEAKKASAAETKAASKAGNQPPPVCSMCNKHHWGECRVCPTCRNYHSGPCKPKAPASTLSSSSRPAQQQSAAKPGRMMTFGEVYQAVMGDITTPEGIDFMVKIAQDPALAPKVNTRTYADAVKSKKGGQ